MRHVTPAAGEQCSTVGDENAEDDEQVAVFCPECAVSYPHARRRDDDYLSQVWVDLHVAFGEGPVKGRADAAIEVLVDNRSWDEGLATEIVTALIANNREAETPIQHPQVEGRCMTPPTYSQCGICGGDGGEMRLINNLGYVMPDGRRVGEICVRCFGEQLARALTPAPTEPAA